MQSKKLIAIQADFLETLRPATDTTILLASELQRRGYQIFFYHPKHLSLHNQEIITEGQFVELNPGAQPFYQVTSTQSLDLRQAALVLVRQNPPFDMDYIMATYILDLLAPSTLVLNNPTALRNHPEKLLPFLLPGFLAPSLCTSNLKALSAFLEQHEHIVLKPCYSFGGQDVIQLKASDNNQEFIFKAYLEKYQHIVAQKFLNGTYNTDKRIFLVDGEVKGAFQRFPQAGEFRTNLGFSPLSEKIELGKRDIEICQALKPILQEKQIFFTGLDIIEDYIIEVNTTSPTGLVVFNELYNTKLEIDIVNCIEIKLNS